VLLKKKIPLLLVAAVASAALFAAPAVREGPGGSALGLFLGQPTGLSYRQYLGDEQSFEAKAAWNLASPNAASILLQANWFLELPGILEIGTADFPLYFGMGVQALIGQSADLGLRIPLGLIYRFTKAPLELCLELSPGIELLPSTTLVGTGGIGLRYRFLGGPRK
jgi:hypothetical protein